MSPQATNPKVSFFPVSDPKSKLALVAELSMTCFLKGKSLSILCPSQAAANFINQHLWSFPAESFLPHGMETTQGPLPIRITCSPESLDPVGTILNLCPTVPEPLLKASEIFELLDETSVDRSQCSAAKRQYYQRMGISL